MKSRILYLLKTYAVTVLLFVVAKLVFLLSGGAGHSVGAADVADVLRHGLSLDLSTALYLTIVPFLVAWASAWVRVPRWVLRAYYWLAALALALAFVADVSLYAFWGFKLDASCLQYLSQPEGITQSVSAAYLLVRFLLTVACTLLFYALYALPPVRFQPLGTLKKRLASTALCIVLVPLMVIGIRGGVNESTTNTGQVYYSQNQFLNHAAVNPVFSFLYSLAHQLNDDGQYAFMDADECQLLTADIYTTESVLTDTLLTTPLPHVVIILLESCGEEFAAVMPRLQQLKQEGVSFSRCYANSWRTDRGTVCALSGYPSFPKVSVMKMADKSRSLPAIARSLQAAGYATSYLYGGDINFTNMRSYLISTGWERLTDMSDYSLAEQHTAEWGVRDDITFQTLESQVAQLQPGRPQLLGYSTLSSHEPWDVPLKRHADPVLNAFAYLDDCLYTFINHVRAMPVWDNLLIVLTADHGINYRDTDQQKPLLKNHIPMLWLGGALRGSATVETICNQSDLAATLLGQLHLDHADFAFSRDVLSATYTHPTAVHNYSNAQCIIDSTGFIVYDFDARRAVMAESDSVEALTRLDKAILQTTYGHLMQLER